MSNCYYHPETRARFVCPDCGQDVCDQCRLDGGLQRCGHCAEHGPPPEGPAPRPASAAVADASGAGQDFISVPVEPFPAGEAFVSVPVEPFPAGEAYEPFSPDEGGEGAPAQEEGYLEAQVAAAPDENLAETPVTGFDDFLAGVSEGGPEPQPEEELVMCTYHGDVVADIQCLNCFQPYCMACLPAGTMCAACKADPQGRAYQEEQVEEVVSDLGYEPGMDFAASYIDSGGITDGVAAYNAAEAARPRRAGGPRKGGARKPMGPKKGGAKGRGAGGLASKLPLIAGGLAVVGLVGAAAWYFLAGPGSVTKKPPPFKGPTKVAISTPKGPVVRGIARVSLKVDSPKQVDHIDVYLGKRKFHTFKKAPFTTDWPTVGGRNGKVEMRVTAYYKHGVKSSAKRVFRIKN